jgi:KUP system potassium uptake protein
MLTALGIVYGDIGTSPLYAIRESFLDEHGVSPLLVPNVMGVLSLIFWSLVLVISVKYLVFILRADNRGEGGILALTSLVTPAGTLRGSRWGLIMLGLFGTALLFGDGVITPAISVLSAVEGLQVAYPALSAWVLPTTVAILAALFLVQKKGTARVGTMFGPVTLLWFIMIATLGIAHIVREPAVLSALSPHHAISFFLRNGWNGLRVLGSVFLVVTGGEALYADMGHLGKRPIQSTWIALVLPALVLNYFGQGALLIRDPAAIENPFYRMAPESLLIPVMLVATAATVIASQALISGVYSLTMQAVQLGYCPRVHIEHTSASQYGQIYIPGVNWALMLACIGLVLGFRSSSALANAYGVAVTTTMVITTVLFFFVAKERWRWRLWKAVPLVAAFLVIDVVFWGANLLKIPEGGWFPLVVGLAVFALLTTWKRGRAMLLERMRDRTLPLATFVSSLARSQPLRVRGTAVFMHRVPDAAPPALLHNIKHNKVLHEQVVFLSVHTEDDAHVPGERRTEVSELGYGVYRIVLHYGFMEHVDVPGALAALAVPGLNLNPTETTYFLARETVVTTKRPGISRFRRVLFSVMLQNQRSATAFFHLPPNRVVELGAQLEL